MTLYLLIGLIYWAINSFVRKLDTEGDWLLPIVWFIAWPLAFAYWFIIFLEKLAQLIFDWLDNKNRTKHF